MVPAVSGTRACTVVPASLLVSVSRPPTASTRSHGPPARRAAWAFAPPTPSSATAFSAHRSAMRSATSAALARVLGHVGQRLHGDEVQRGLLRRRQPAVIRRMHDDK